MKKTMALGLLASSVLLAGCGGQSNVKLVKEGILHDDPSLTVAQALDTRKV
ncbi:hypothetical protein ACQKPX_07200 [Photobacterium sp. DNB23_23_1]|uniref:Uncharacterized protein n=1 Tax=Photobacterium pectinilyticum TaxID=2906793 RepID=A0ABT1N9D3_9GAMM|nr:hypothetical protein [Photobacterium sp. ZSDE20]MCQ1061333.1 hypothetical protein [Photobacterium sp. ZSDE20]